MARISFDSTIPVLRIFSLEKAREFYVDYLGFEVDWEHRFEEGAPLYMQVSRDGLVLHLTEHHGDATPGSRIFVHIRGLDLLLREIAGHDYRHLNPSIEEAPWGGRVMELIDPFGNRLCFAEAAADDGADT